MRSFIIALALIAVISVFIIANSIYIRSICDDMIDLTNGGEYYAVRDKWDDVRGYLGLFLRDTEVDRADISIRELINAIESGDEGAAGENATALIDALIEIRQCETPTFTGIF